MNFKEIRKQLNTFHYGTEITKEDFERQFTKTNERITFTFNGWDGKSYNGETRTARVLHADLAGCEKARFIKVGKGVHMIAEDSAVVEKATGLVHKEVDWLIDVARV